MRILIIGASSEIALNVIRFFPKFQFYGLSTSSKAKLINKFKEYYIVKSYDADVINEYFKKFKEGYFDSVFIFNGIYSNSLLINFNRKLFLNTIENNLIAPLQASSLIIRNKILKSGSSINFIGSVASKAPEIGNAYYALAKNSLFFSMKIIAKELKNKNVRCNILTLGLVKTKMAKDLLKSYPKDLSNLIFKKQNDTFVSFEDIANAMLFLIENKSINGKEIILDNNYLL